MPVRTSNINLLLMVDNENTTNDAQLISSYLFINNTIMYTNDSYFNPDESSMKSFEGNII